MEDLSRRLEDCDERQRADHDNVVRHETRLDQRDKEHADIVKKVEELRKIVDKLSTDRARLIALCVGASSVAGIVIKVFWPK